jgi:hypothetical protein
VCSSDLWFRLTYTLGALASPGRFVFALVPSTTSLRLASFSGNGTDGAFIWGAQLVEGTDAKPYFATTNRQDVPRLDYRNADGSVSTCPRLLLEPQRTNSLRNSTMVGAVAGSPGTTPTNWIFTIGGLTGSVSAIGIENGLQYVDIKLSGTATSTSAQIRFEGLTNIAALNAQVWTNSVYLKTISSAPNSIQLGVIERTSAGGYITEAASSALSVTSTLRRFDFTRTLSGGATTAFVQPQLAFSLTNGAAYDFTIRIAAPQMELGAYATTFIPTTTAAVTRLVDAFSRNNVFTNGLISAAGGTWFLEFNNNVALTADANSRSLSIGDNAPGTTNAINIINSPIQIRTRISGTVGNTYTTTSSSVVKIAIKWNGTTIDYFVNGVKVLTGGLFAITNMNFLDAAGINTPKFINQSALFPTPLTDAQLVDLTGGRIYYNPVEAYYAYYLTPEIPSAVITSVNSFF